MVVAGDGRGESASGKEGGRRKGGKGRRKRECCTHNLGKPLNQVHDHWVEVHVARPTNLSRPAPQGHTSLQSG